jgi:hypothetical protein
MGARPNKGSPPRFVVCIDNFDYEASLELHKIYPVIPAPDAAEDGDLRISTGFLCRRRRFRRFVN